jgi:predicted DNA-binding protein (MmcQ/YjbR family)
VLKTRRGRTQARFRPSTAFFKVAGKVFAIVATAEEPSRLTLKCEPDYGSNLNQEFDDISSGCHMKKRLWITISPNKALSIELPEDLISNSFFLASESMLGSLAASMNRSIYIGNLWTP